MYGFAREGVLFDNFYANGFRTDRGIVSIMSGYPSHPTVAILKHPKKTESLPSISKSLKSAGYYNQSMYYGGDINFANMRSYFVGACGITGIVSDSDFPVKERLTKWGVPDRPLFDRVYRDVTGGIKAADTEGTVSRVLPAPFLKVVLTLSSHEPFDVPVDTYEEPFLNAVNYTDKCIGDFVSGLRKTDLWDNTLIIFLADHAMQSYPPGTDNYKEVRYKIPMVWIGGAVRQPCVIPDYGSQNDLAATLLSQLNIDYSDFKFSKDMLNPLGRKFSFYSYVNGFCMRDSTNIFLYDNDRQTMLEQVGNPALEKEAKSYFQMMYLDLGGR
jgi:phosphoglycerol transferase MdoB-like AlkP superfamily enzyme